MATLCTRFAGGSQADICCWCSV